MKLVDALKTFGITLTIASVFLVPHFLAGVYAQPKPAAADCAKPDGPPGSRA